MHGKTKKQRDNWYKKHMSKGKRIVRYIGRIIKDNPHFTNRNVLDEIQRIQPSFDEVNWDFIQLVRVFNYSHYAENDLLTNLFHQGYITEQDLTIRRLK